MAAATVPSSRRLEKLVLGTGPPRQLLPRDLTAQYLFIPVENGSTKPRKRSSESGPGQPGSRAVSHEGPRAQPHGRAPCRRRVVARGSGHSRPRPDQQRAEGSWLPTEQGNRSLGSPAFPGAMGYCAVRTKPAFGKHLRGASHGQAAQRAEGAEMHQTSLLWAVRPSVGETVTRRKATEVPECGL